jgi:hypothetical protein
MIEDCMSLQHNWAYSSLAGHPSEGTWLASSGSRVLILMELKRSEP